MDPERRVHRNPGLPRRRRIVQMASAIEGQGRDVQASATIVVAEPPRPDGYRPLTESTWSWARITGTIHPDALRVVWNAARRLDAAHREFERLREGLNRSRELRPGTIAWRRQVFATLGDAEMAVVALSRALQLTLRMPGRFRSLRIPVPRTVKSRAANVRSLRSKCEHLENDESQRPLIQDHQLVAVFRASRLFTERRIVSEPYSIGIDEEATKLMVQARDYLVKITGELSTSRTPIAPASSGPTRRRR